MKNITSIFVFIFILATLPLQSQHRTELQPGERYAFTLVAKTSTGDTIKDWNTTGVPVHLFALPNNANSDTSSQSWTSDPDAYTWTRIFHNDQQLPLHPSTFSTVAPELFENGVCRLEFASTKSASRLTLGIIESAQPITCISDTLSIMAGPVAKLTLELTSHVQDKNAVYVDKPCELIVTPQDKFSNETADSVAVQFSPAITGIFSDNARYYDFNNHYPVVIDKQTAFYTSMLAVHEAASGDTLQNISVTSLANGAFSGSTGDMEILSHPPSAFMLLAPENHERIMLISWSTKALFTWEESTDPVNTISVSRFTSEKCTDVVQYRITFLDSASLTKKVTIESDDLGNSPRFTSTHGQFVGIVETIYSGSRLHANLFWQVKATDGLYSVLSTPGTTTSEPGHYLSLDLSYIFTPPPPPPPASYVLETCYPNPVYSSSGFHFQTPEDGHVLIQVYNSMGACVRTLLDEYLPKGYHRQEILSRDLGSGTYTVIMRTKGATLERRFIVTK